MYHLTEMLKSIFAGMAIAIGATLFLMVGGVAGAIGFTIGLYLVLWFKLNLYTGKIGYASSWKQIPMLLCIFIGNLIGCLAFMFCPTLAVSAAAAAIMTTKLSTLWYVVILKSIICGILIYAAVDQYKKGKEYAPIIAVPAFILCGAEHCIADMCFAIAAGTIFTWPVIGFIFLVALGNSIGSILFRYSMLYIDNAKKN
jgi:formate/nitrite transporter FocA (FNT family)